MQYCLCYTALEGGRYERTHKTFAQSARTQPDRFRSENRRKARNRRRLRERCPCSAGFRSCLHLPGVWCLGEMFLQLSREEEITKFCMSIIRDPDSEFQRQFVSVLARLEPPQWQLLSDMADKLLAQRDAQKKDAE